MPQLTDKPMIIGPWWLTLVQPIANGIGKSIERWATKRRRRKLRRLHDASAKAIKKLMQAASKEALDAQVGRRPSDVYRPKGIEFCESDPPATSRPAKGDESGGT